MAQQAGIPRYQSKATQQVAPRPGYILESGNIAAKMWQNIAGSLQGAIGIGETYSKIIHERDVRDTETSISSIIRERSIMSLSMQGKNADNLMENETEWAAKARDEVIKNSKLNANAAGALWDKRIDPYLNRVTTHQINEGLNSLRQSKIGAVVDSQNDLAKSEVGDFSAFAEYHQKVTRDIYPDEMDMQTKALEQGMTTMIDNWAAKDPEKTVEWFNNNKDELAGIFARHFSDVNKVIYTWEQRMDRKAELAQNVEFKRIQREDRQQALRSRQWFNDSMRKFYDPEEKDFDPNAVIAQAVADEINGDVINTFENVVNRKATAQKKAESEAIYAQYLGDATMIGLSEREQETVTRLLNTGYITGAQYNNIMRANDRAAKYTKTGLAKQRTMAMKNLENAIAPKGGIFGAASQEATAAYLSAALQLDNYLDTLSTPAEKLQALNFNDEKSYISALIRAATEGVTAQQRARKGFDPQATFKQQGEVDVPGYPPTTERPDGSTAPKQPLESFFGKGVK